MDRDRIVDKCTDSVLVKELPKGIPLRTTHHVLMIDMKVINQNYFRSLFYQLTSQVGANKAHATGDERLRTCKQICVVSHDLSSVRKECSAHRLKIEYRWLLGQKLSNRFEIFAIHRRWIGKKLLAIYSIYRNPRYTAVQFLECPLHQAVRS